MDVYTREQTALETCSVVQSTSRLHYTLSQMYPALFSTMKKAWC